MQEQSDIGAWEVRRSRLNPEISCATLKSQAGRDIIATANDVVCRRVGAGVHLRLQERRVFGSNIHDAGQHRFVIVEVEFHAQIKVVPCIDSGINRGITRGYEYFSVPDSADMKPPQVKSNVTGFVA